MDFTHGQNAALSLFTNGFSGWAGDVAIMLRTLPTPIRMMAADFLSPLSIDAIIKKVMEVVDADLQFDVDFLQKTHLLRNRLETVDETLTLVTRRRRHYLTMVMIPAHPKALTRLLLSDHNLSVERLRYPVRYRLAIPREERLCRFCRDGVEDEVHLLLECEGSSRLTSGKCFPSGSSWQLLAQLAELAKLGQICQLVPELLPVSASLKKFLFLCTTPDVLGFAEECSRHCKNA
ncbi:hypothetical protein B0H11DRAFT_2325025 [Mycena galericulata]|nr:hypothetical protein B0H11DRAFT_2325025 [Mycena galericulata]